MAEGGLLQLDVCGEGPDAATVHNWKPRHKPNPQRTVNKDDQRHSYDGPFSDPVYKQISLTNGEVNRMTKLELREQLAKYHMDTRGVKEVLKKRLKNLYKKQKLVKARIANVTKRETPYDYLVIIDFEATCEESNGTNFPHEIIEFPAILLNTNTLKVESEFHEYCRPQKNSKLSPFCTELTGITQEVIDSADAFPDVLQRMESWLSLCSNDGASTYAIVTDGPWDMSRFMQKQCQISEIKFPRWARKWVNVRKTYRNFYGFAKANLRAMLENLGMAFIGKPHSGIDDARNIARVVGHIMADGCSVHVNEKLLAYRLQENAEILYDVVPVLREDEKNDVDDCEIGESGDVPILQRGHTRQQSSSSSHHQQRKQHQQHQVPVKQKSVREKQREEVENILKQDDNNIEDLLFYLNLQNS
ncbi:3'-5' exoribonuclease 1-like [Tubulanus polymorphus]|uniref:3'-5' exoribonuclease 1-like n=1 Tax=Tubulanus polymorphus TaxID=672921 RepID=UPI003DA37A34